MKNARYLAIFSIWALLTSQSLASEFSRPWQDSSVAIVLDPYEGNSINWTKVATDSRVVGVIHRATIGMSTDNSYGTRKIEAKARGYLWGAYHLLTNLDPESQIDNFLSVTGIEADQTYAIDVECLSTLSGCTSPSYQVTVAQIDAAVSRFKHRTGRLPLIYANGSVTHALGSALSSKPNLAGIKLWHARFKSNLTSFPEGIWPSYALWQFSSEINCAPAPAACPYRVLGTKADMDLNVYNGSVKDARKNWPLD